MLISEPCDANSTLYPPPDFPLCGPLGDKCEVQGPNITLIVSVALAVILALVIIGGLVGYRHYREEAAIASMHWKISSDEIMASKATRGR